MQVHVDEGWKVSSKNGNRVVWLIKIILNFDIFSILNIFLDSVKNQMKTSKHYNY